MLLSAGRAFSSTSRLLPASGTKGSACLGPGVHQINGAPVPSGLLSVVIRSLAIKERRLGTDTASVSRWESMWAPFGHEDGYHRLGAVTGLGMRARIACSRSLRSTRPPLRFNAW